MNKDNLVRTIMSGISGLALLVSLEGCATTLPHQDPTTKIWYDCQTNMDYPTEHPCYSVVAEYKVAHASSSSSKDNSDRGSDNFESKLPGKY